MTLTKIFFVLGLLTLVSNSTLSAKSDELPSSQLDQTYLEQWFSIDSSELDGFLESPVEDDSIGARVDLRFTSDDGHAVNGTIGFPADESAPTKLALALHPMGSDQQFWWNPESRLGTHKLTMALRKQGFTVISLDARRHGERASEGFGPRELLKRAHSAQPRLYTETIIGSVRDYRALLAWAKERFQPEQVLVMGYSMGAQMALLLASYEHDVSTVLAMVPPYVKSDTSPVAPRIHVDRITSAKVLWLAGDEDPYSNRQQTSNSFERISSAEKTLTWFDAGHRLPPESISTALSFLNSLESGDAK